MALIWPQIGVLILTVFHAIGLTIDYANGFLLIYTIVDAIRFIIDYANDTAIEYAIDYAIGKVKGQWLYFELFYWLCHLL